MVRTAAIAITPLLRNVDDLLKKSINFRCINAYLEKI